MNDVLASLRYLLGDRAVFLPVAFGDKKPTLAGWQKLTFAQSQTAEHRRALELAIARGGNLGVLLGEPSEGLCSIDIDVDSLVEPFLTNTPGLRDTLITRGGERRSDYLSAFGRLSKNDSQAALSRWSAIRRMARRRWTKRYLRQTSKRLQILDRA